VATYTQRKVAQRSSKDQVEWPHFLGQLLPQPSPGKKPYQKMSDNLAHLLAKSCIWPTSAELTHTAIVTRDSQGHNEVRWRTGARSTFGALMFKPNFFLSKCTVLKKVIVTLLGRLFGTAHSDSAPKELCTPRPPRYTPGDLWQVTLHCVHAKSQVICENKHQQH